MYKTAIKIAAAAMLATMVVGCGGTQEQQTKESAASLMTINRGLDSVFTSLKQSYETYQASEMDNALEGLNKYLTQASESLRAMDIEKDCLPLQKAISDKIEAMRNIAATDAKEQVRIYKIPDADFTEELLHQWDNISATVDKKLSSVSSIVSKAYDEINNNKSDK
ncbi:MAG: hypothetical protein II075_09755 [Bacteroidales bacterium]|jgi:hypothetical protein|nr:hypothetical protein [Bacteroidales bacterium]